MVYKLTEKLRNLREISKKEVLETASTLIAYVGIFIIFALLIIFSTK